MIERIRFTDPMATLTKSQLAEKLNISVWTLARWTKEGRVPPPIRLTEQTLVWRLATILAWLRDQERKSVGVPQEVDGV